MNKRDQQLVEIERAAGAGEITEAQALEQLQALGMDADQAGAFLHIAMGGSDVVEMD